MVGSGQGVQVLFAEEGGYRCDAHALRRVAGGDARALPAVVVSVAGATRGGKSFLLDFFLRYLQAPGEARRSGAWLGAEDAPLTGFSWRGGCDPHTEGILIWSEPIVVDLDRDGKTEKVGVVLLDTQGAFDSSSTLRDSSTVFALSALLSSVQIYNLAHNISEDNLHYLQLFTEYGRLALEGGEKPFQELRFLVRDWSFAYDHPFGAEGGQQLLDKRLQITEQQASELREVRTHMRDAFERVSGFLLPHPGLTAATSPAFTGCLKDISSEFKNSLLELVPLLFSPSNLAVKRINSHRVTVQDFVEYFTTYVEIFNSDTLPTPTTVMQATSAASMELDLRECRNKYHAQMEQCSGGACVPRAAVARHHAAALDAARHMFAARRTLAVPALAAARLDALLQDLDASLADYVARNSGRIMEAAARCRAGYEAAMEADECLSPEELTEQHESAVTAARRAFCAEFATTDYTKKYLLQNNDENLEEREEHEEHESTNGGEHENSNEEDDDDEEEHNDEEFECDNEDWKTLEKELSDLLPLHRERNAARAASARECAREMYAERMRGGLATAPCLHPESLSALHGAALSAARECMRAAWRSPHAVPPQHEHDLTNDIQNIYEEFVATNHANNKQAVEEAISIYKNIMEEICNSGGRCLHPRDLTAQHERAEEAAAAYFRERRDAAVQQWGADNHTRAVHKGVIPLYLKFEEINEERNKAAVKDAHEFYQRHIRPGRAPAGVAGDFTDMFGPLDLNVIQRHQQVRNRALQQFHSKRRECIRGPDNHLDELNKRIEASYGWIKVKLLSNVTTTVAGVFAAGSLMFLGRR